MVPVRCRAGQFFGGYPLDHSKDYGRVKLVGVKLVLTDTAADTATELELEDWPALKTNIKTENKPYVESGVKMSFHHKSSADDSGQFFSFAANPVQCVEGIKVKTNTNCRPILYVE